MRHVLVLPLLLLSGCETIGFYSQGVAGQAEILWKSRPNSKLLASDHTSEALKSRLALAGELCDFASQELALPGHAAYHRYADLGRDHVVYVMHAAREFSLEPKTWRYPIVGEMDYRGYFRKTDAEGYAEMLRTEGYEIHLGGVDAYSTLGFFHDPLLNTFITYPEISFAETIFHELTHRRFFRRDDTEFNESLANMVAEEGVRRWLTSKGRTADLADYEKRLVKRRDFHAEIEFTREELTRLYASGMPEPEMRERKHRILTELKSRARDLQRRWGTKQLEEWLRLDLTNAHLLALITYNSRIPEFQNLLNESGGDFETFFDEVEELPSGR